MRSIPTFIFAFCLQGITHAQDLQPSGATAPVAQLCGGSGGIVCVQRYVCRTYRSLLSAHCTTGLSFTLSFLPKCLIELRDFRLQEHIGPV